MIARVLYPRMKQRMNEVLDFERPANGYSKEEMLNIKKADEAKKVGLHKKNTPVVAAKLH